MSDQLRHLDREAALLRKEIRRLKAELRRVTEECDILKKATAYFATDHK